MENEPGRVVAALPGPVWTARPDGHAGFLEPALVRDAFSGPGATFSFMIPARLEGAAGTHVRASAGADAPYSMRIP